MFKLITIVFCLFCFSACQVSHPAKVMYNPSTGDRVVVSHHGTTGKLGSAIAARFATERDIEALKSQGYQEVSH